MILTKDDVDEIFPLNSEQCEVIGIEHRGTKKSHLVGMELSEKQFEHVKLLRGLKRNIGGYPRIKERKAVLEEMGFSSYSDYLKSETWQNVRRMVFQLRGGVCLCCFENTARVVHHEIYSKGTLTGRRDAVRKWLVPLCHECHENRHFDSGKWNTRFGKKPINAWRR